MAPMKQDNNNYSSNHYGEDVDRHEQEANILASCYLGPSGIPEVPSTGLPSPPSSPPLAAITSTNQLALTPKTYANNSKSSASIGSSGNGRHGSSRVNTSREHRRGGAALRIREECERFFCEMLRAMFLGERNAASQRSGLTSVYHHQHNTNNNTTTNITNINNNINTNGQGGFAGSSASAIASYGQLTPPDDYPIANKFLMASRGVGGTAAIGGMTGAHHRIDAWLEIWDYAGGSSFRAFMADDMTSRADDTKSLFVFFDEHVLSRDLKQALVALIELAEGPLACAHMVICLDRSIPREQTTALTKGLQWAGFALTTLRLWSGGRDVVSDRWLFMGMEV
ncbi:ornithine decarboxylase antizyme-domain-containing protein [Podospora appendiculata]|uniref:Ornithine decarboxylase antizyme n=1 Tax=Podospora appendiculata TaxID=314037 RepID=A0AAE0WZG8_9PEZI|nr:ornithine decarboxylase antizyme-domain-containing protein [Podospora appendiculata]